MHVTSIFDVPKDVKDICLLTFKSVEYTINIFIRQLYNLYESNDFRNQLVFLTYICLLTRGKQSLIECVADIVIH